MNRVLAVFLLGFSLIAFLALTRWKEVANDPIIRSDGQGYYAYLPAVFIYHDLSLNFVWDINDTYYRDGLAAPYVNHTRYGTIDKYFSGTAVLQTPFFLLSHAVAVILGMPADGYSPPYQLGVAVSGIFYLCLGLWFLHAFLMLYGFNRLAAGLACVGILFGTNLLYYSLYAPSMSHVFSFSAVSGFLYFSARALRQGRVGSWIGVSVTLGFIALIRPTNAIVLLALPSVSGSWKQFTSGLKNLVAERNTFVVAVIALLLIISVQPLIYFFQTGRPFVWSYGDEGFNFLRPNLFNVLFSYRKGVFIYAPILLLGPVGFLMSIRRNAFQGLWLLFFLFMVIWIISSWWMWHYGGGYGHRAFIEFYPFFAIGMAGVFQHGLGLIRPWAMVVLATMIISVQLIQTYQYVNNIILYDGMDKTKFWGVFLRTGKDLSWYYPVNDSILKCQAQDSSVVSHNMEQYRGWGNEQQLTDEVAFEGNKSDLLGIKDQYGLTYGGVADSLTEWNLIRITSYVNSNSWSSDISWVVEMKDSTGQVYFWGRIPLRTQFKLFSAWNRTQSIFLTGKPRHGSDKVAVYPFKTDDSVVYIDNVAISFVRSQ